MAEGNSIAVAGMCGPDTAGLSGLLRAADIGDAAAGGIDEHEGDSFVAAGRVVDPERHDPVRVRRDSPAHEPNRVALWREVDLRPRDLDRPRLGDVRTCLA